MGAQRRPGLHHLPDRGPAHVLPQAPQPGPVCGRPLDISAGVGHHQAASAQVDAITDEMVAAEAATGKAQLWEHTDVYGQPVVLVRADRHVIGAMPLEQSQLLCVHVLEKAQKDAEQRGSETVLGVFDLGKFTTRNADLGFITFLIEVLLMYYPKRLSQVLFV